MKRLGELIWKYFVPCMILVIALSTYLGGPDDPIVVGLPITPGEHQTLVSLGLAFVALLLALAIWRHDPEKTAK